MNRKIRYAALVAVFLISTNLYAADILIGVSAAFKGPSRGLGIELYRGYSAYFNYINSQGGIQGNQLRLRPYDDGYDPVQTIENTIRLADQDGVWLLFGYVGTPTVTRILPLLKRYDNKHLYLFFPFTGANTLRQPPYGEYVFNLRASYQEETEGLVESFIHIGRRRIAVFYQIDAYGRTGWDGVRKALAARGLRIVSESTYRRGTPFEQSMKAQVEILKKGNPDAIISVGAYAACAALIRDARDSGLDIPIANVSFVGSESLIDLLLAEGKKRKKDYTKNLMNSQVVPSYEEVSLPAVREYRQMMDGYASMPPSVITETGYTPLKYSFVSLEGFLNAKLLTEILNRMPAPWSRDQIRATAESIDSLDLGIRWPVSISPQKHQGLNAIYYTTVEAGRFVPLTDWSRWKK